MRKIGEDTLKIGVSLKPHMLNDDHLSFFRSFGCESIIAWVPLPRGDGIWHVADLARIKALVNRHGMELAAIEGFNPGHFDHIVLNEPGREEQMENLFQTIRNVGKVGIPVISYSFNIIGVWGYYSERDNQDGRGGARVKKFDVTKIPTDQPPNNRQFWFESIQTPGLFQKDLEHRSPEGTLPPVEADEMWERLDYFLKRAVPVAEEAGVTLAAHPDDPPVPMMRGMYRLLHSVESLQRLIDLVPSPNNSLAFCQGTVSTMKDVDILDAIRTFTAQKRISYVHFRNTTGGYPRWSEVFIDEGEVDMIEAMKAYRDGGFTGTLVPDHTPYVDLAGDFWWEVGTVYAMGYMIACRQALEKFD